jgi:superfamily II DNA or RNA helicase
VLLDNKSQGRVIEALRDALVKATSASILTSDLSVFAWDALRTELKALSATRLLLTPSLGEPPAKSPSLLGGPEERRFRNALTGLRIARALDQWVQRTSVDLRRSSAMVPHSLYYAQTAEGAATAIQGSSPLTAPGLGLTPSARHDLNTLFSDPESAKSLLAFFESLWSSATPSPGVKALLHEQLRAIYEPQSPQVVYFQTLHRLFGENIEDLDEDRIVRTRTGIRDTLVWQKLYRFQRDGVVGAIDKLERYNGCIIADSVGLGKTFEALAIIKYYELRNDRVLVLAPKRLRDNWTVYTINDKRNLFAADRFNYDVLNHTDLTRRGGRSGEINLETLNWGNYDLVVIDESHNFRNNPPRRDGLTRYGRLMRDIIQSGVKTKVLMLSATPVNSRMNDLKNQVAFITEGVDDALADAGIASIEFTLRKAQTLFNQWLRDTEERTAQGLLDALNFDYFKLLDLLTIARSRKHIAKYYDLEEVGAFPLRAPPINVKADIDTAGLFPPLREVNRDIRRLHLAAYAPLRYVLPHKLPEYSRRYDMEVSGGRSFRQLDREESLIHLMRVNLLKRMESSIHSFALTVGKLLGKVQALLKRIDAHDAGDLEAPSIEEIDLESDDFALLLVGNKVKVLLHDVDRVRWRQDLQEDEEVLTALLREARQVDPARDEKLRRLKELITAKVNEPINPGNRKLLVFTAFADTAEYLYEHLADWAHANFGLRSALVTGRGGANKTTLPGIRTDLASVLTAFSPISKERSAVDASATTEIDLIVATDCISEGQNLQDCDYLVNYDIHWNPVRIIQRFGRIDRLGSHNQTIQLVNFWPNMELDEYINLEARVSGRMVLLDISATGEENVIDAAAGERMNDLAYRRRQFEQLQEQVLDLEDLSGGISITDLTLGDFRMDLARYVKHHGDALDALPLGIYGAVSLDDLDEDEALHPGVFFCLRCENSALERDPSYPLAPHYLVYVGEDGATRLNFHQTRRVLELMKKVGLGRSQPDPAATRAFELATHKGARMEGYQELLAKAVAAVTGKSEELGVASLFERGGTALTRDSFRGVDDFEVVAWLAVLGEEARP